MTPDSSGAVRRLPENRAGRHRAPSKKQQIVVRIIGIGAAAGCIALVSEMNAPDAEALSILLPAGNGNATQINILEGNVFDPQFGLGGNGSNESNNSTIGGLMFGLGNKADGSTGSALSLGPIALGGATGNGNVTQINILSYNIINPQWSLMGGNTSSNTTNSNAAVGNGNNSDTTVDGTSTMLGGAMGNGNTTQIALLSGNIFNPQVSLFGSNVSNNTAITNVSALNGNGSTTNATSGGLFGTSLFGMTGNGNSTQLAGATSNIFNPQISILGQNTSNNYANANQASFNGRDGNNSVGATGGLGDITSVGQTGNGNTTQNAAASGNIYNNQLRLGLGGLLPSTTNSQQTTLTNEQVSSTPSGQPGLTEEQLLLLEQQQQGSSSATGTVVSPGPGSLKTVVSKLKDAVDQTLTSLTKPKTSASTGSPEGSSAPSNSGTP
jgi:hypothetical protein